MNDRLVRYQMTDTIDSFLRVRRWRCDNYMSNNREIQIVFLIYIVRPRPCSILSSSIDAFSNSQDPLRRTDNLAKESLQAISDNLRRAVVCG